MLDCGLFQGFKVHRERNWAPPPREMLEADAVVLSHAHLDHSGWLPLLVRHGFKGPVYASPATRDLAQVLLLDSAHLQEEDARRANRYGYSRHAKALPLYTRADARRALARIKPLVPGRELALGDVTLRLDPVGHLLGACAISLRHRSGRLLFSGDLGRSDDLLMPPPEPPQPADVLLIESTYGNRRHHTEDPMARLGAIVRDTIGRGGSVLMPSFAVGRAQALLVTLQRLKASGEIPHQLPVFLDSPMAIEATALYRRHGKLLAHPAARGALDVRRRAHRDHGAAVDARWCARATRRSSSRPAAWPPAGGCCITSRRWRRTRAITSSSPASRSVAAAAHGWSAAPPRSRSTANTSRCGRRSASSRASRAMPTPTA